MHSPWLKNTGPKEAGQDIGSLLGSPEEGEPYRELMMLVGVRQIKDNLCVSRVSPILGVRMWGRASTYLGDETALEDGQKGTANEEQRLPRTSKLAEREDAPESNLRRDSAIRADLLANKLRRQLGAEERKFKDRVSEVVVQKTVVKHAKHQPWTGAEEQAQLTVRSHPGVTKEVTAHGLL